MFEVSNVDEKCETCRFWEHKGADSRGECHRYPEFVVRYDYEWCGEHDWNGELIEMEE